MLIITYIIVFTVISLTKNLILSKIFIHVKKNLIIDLPKSHTFTNNLRESKFNLPLGFEKNFFFIKTILSNIVLSIIGNILFFKLKNVFLIIFLWNIKKILIPFIHPKVISYIGHIIYHDILSIIILIIISWVITLVVNKFFTTTTDKLFSYFKYKPFFYNCFKKINDFFNLYAFELLFAYYPVYPISFWDAAVYIYASELSTMPALPSNYFGHGAGAARHKYLLFVQDHIPRITMGHNESIRKLKKWEAIVSALNNDIGPEGDNKKGGLRDIFTTHIIQPEKRDLANRLAEFKDIKKIHYNLHPHPAHEEYIQEVCDNWYNNNYLI